MKRLVVLLGLMAAFSGPASVLAGCGGTERWAVKTGTDPGAANVNLTNVVPITVKGLNDLPNLQGTVPRNDNTTRLDTETVIYQVQGRLVLFKHETDADYHLVITDDSLKYTPGGKGTNGLETGTSFIAEIPDPNCEAGAMGDPSIISRFDAQLRDVRKKFEARFPGGAGADTDLGGIPVTLTGVLFYDRPHNQTGRAVNGVELHPLLDISFEGGETPPPPPTTTTPTTNTTTTTGALTQLLANPGFEDGITGWSGTVDDIGSYENVTAHSGTNLAWMGGTGKAHTETLYQNVSIPETAKKATLAMWYEINTEETSSTQKYDKLYVQVRDANGKLLKTLKVFSNLDQNSNYQREEIDLSNYIGQAIMIYLKVVEDNGNATSFLIDDVTLEIK